MPNIDDAFNEAYAALGLEDNSDDLGPSTETATPEGDEPGDRPAADGGDQAPGEGDPEGDENPAEENAEDDDGLSPTGPAQYVEISDENVVLRLPDGTEVPFKEAALRHADYTKKTQEVAAKRKEIEEQAEQLTAREAEVDDLFTRMSDWYEERSSNPADWVSEIVNTSDNPTVTLARALKGLVDAGSLDPEFVRVFGLEAPEVSERVETGERDERLSKVEQELEARRQAEAEQTQVQEAIAHYNAQLQQVVGNYGLEFDSVVAEQQFRSDLLQYAVDNEIPDLDLAYRAYEFERARNEQPKPATPDPAVTQRKRATRAITPRGASAAAGAPRPRPTTTEEAARLTIEEFAARGA